MGCPTNSKWTAPVSPPSTTYQHLGNSEALLFQSVLSDVRWRFGNALVYWVGTSWSGRSGTETTNPSIWVFGTGQYGPRAACRYDNQYGTFGVDSPTPWMNGWSLIACYPW